MAQQRERGFKLGIDTASFTSLHWVMLVLLAITGAIHLYLYATEGFIPFLLAGLGFYGAIGILLVGLFRRLVYLGLIPYTIAQIAGWYMLDGNLTPLAIGDKIVQILLIVLLAYLFWKEGQEGVPLVQI